jgi:hypothetical protein
MHLDEDLTLEEAKKLIRQVHLENFGNDDTTLVESVFSDITDLFYGKKTGYQACDIGYHDFSHTLQTIPPFLGIIDGWNKTRSPRVSKTYFDLGVIAVLLHDTGYIKNDNDREGTGAKYTFIHIQRSADFANVYLSERGFDAGQIVAVQNAIRCTGVVFDNKVRFTTEEERIIGYALGTADLLGQMSASDYLKKLSMLYREFEESYQYEGMEELRRQGIKIFENAKDLIKSTPYFFEGITMARFKRMGSVYTCLNRHFANGSNPYMEQIKKNIERINRYFPPGA